MRNSILVRNSTFYISSLKEKGSLKNISCLTKLNDDKYENFNFTGIDVKREDLNDVRLSPLNINIRNATVYQEFDDMVGVSVFAIDKVKSDILEYLTFNPITCNVRNKCFNAVVFSKKDTYECLNSYNVHVYDKHLIIEESCNSFEENELTLIVDKLQYEKTLQGTRNLCVINCKSEYNDNNIIAYKSSTVNVKEKECIEYLIREEASITIKTPKKDNSDGYDNMPSININVVNVSNETSPGDSNSGGDLEKLIFTIQQMSFFEFKLVFKANKVKEVFNLPEGLFFDKDGQRIIGTPMKSGRYSISIIFEDMTSMEGIVDVPKLNREL